MDDWGCREAAIEGEVSGLAKGESSSMGEKATGQRVAAQVG